MPTPTVWAMPATPARTTRRTTWTRTVSAATWTTAPMTPMPARTMPTVTGWATPATAVPTIRTMTLTPTATALTRTTVPGRPTSRSSTTTATATTPPRRADLPDYGTTPVEIEGVDEAAQLSLSNPMDINRGVADHAQAVAIIGDLFTLGGKANERIVIHSDSDRLDRIGAAMTRGEIQVEGCAGAYLGQQMQGGCLQVSGDAGQTYMDQQTAKVLDEAQNATTMKMKMKKTTVCTR